MMMNNYYIYDTCALLNKASNLFDETNSQIVITNITLEELENIKTSANKDADIKFSARKLLDTLDQHPSEYEVIIFKTYMLDALHSVFLDINNDTKILACAIDWAESHEEQSYFVTDDRALKQIASLYFNKENILSTYSKEIVQYTGFKEIIPTEQELITFYQDCNNNIFNCLTNEYLIIKSPEGEIVDVRCWNGKEYRGLKYTSFESKQFGRVIPFKNDIYQKLLFDSLVMNDMTLIGGPPGSGKTAVALAYLFDELEHGAIDRIVIFCNPVAARGASKLGYYPGTREEKLLSSQIGAILTSKLGSIEAVEKFIDEGTIVLLPAADARGYETPPHSGVYIMEAQNLDVILLKMLIQRVGEHCKIIIDGDNARQIDLNIYAGANNGIKRLSEIFRGEDYYGEVTLQNVYRSKIAEKAEEM